MTNEEAIGILALVVETAKGRCFVTDEAISDAYERAINALTRQTALKEKCLVCEHCDRCDSELANHSPKVNSDSGDPISRRDAIECLEHLSACDEPFEEIGTDDETFIGKYEAITGISDLPPAQPEPLLDEIVDEIRKTIAETESNGKYHADPVRHNGEMICHGLQIALNIIEEKRNERSD